MGVVRLTIRKFMDLSTKERELYALERVRNSPLHVNEKLPPIFEAGESIIEEPYASRILEDFKNESPESISNT